jgi:hypothetical protein
MTDDDLDHLLESHDDIVPSPNFAEAVMAAVRRKGWETPPLGFPWARAALGALIAVAVVVFSVGAGLMTPATAGSTVPDSVGTGEMLTAIGDATIRVGVGWMVLALSLTLASVGLSSQLASRVEGQD